MWAAANGHADAVDVLLKAGANPKPRRKAASPRSIFAAREGRSENRRKPAAAGADVNYTVPAGLNALLIAVTGKKTDGCRVLIAHGANVNR